MKLNNPTARAYATYMYNHCDGPAYEMWRSIHLWPPRRKAIAKQARASFAEVGTDQLQWGEQAARICRANRIDPVTEPMSICFDAAKCMAEARWDENSNSFVNCIDFSTRLQFDTYEDLTNFFSQAANKLAG